MKYLHLSVLSLIFLLAFTPSHAKTNTAPPAEEPAVIFEVTSTEDLSDSNPGNGTCAASNGECTLRAAIEETNNLAGMDTIDIPAGTYFLNSKLVVKDSLNIRGAGKDMTIIDGQESVPNLDIRTVELLVCDNGNDSIASYDINGQRNLDFLSSGAGGMDSPGALAIGPSGDIFVTALLSGVHRFSSTGSNLGIFIDSEDITGFLPTDGIFGQFPDNDFFVTDYFPNNRVLRYDPNTSTLQDTISSSQMEQPNSLAFYEGDLYITNATSDEILRYDGGTGDFIETFVSFGLSLPRGLTFKDDILYVSNQNTNSILRFDATDGSSLGTFVSSESGGLEKPSDLAFGPEGDLYVLSQENDNILRYDGNTGSFKEVFIQGGDNIFLENPSCLLWRQGVGDGPIVNISGITLQNGQSPTGGAAAGLDIDRGAYASLRSSSVKNNTSSTFGGGIQNWGTLDIYDSDIINNKLPEGGGGVTSQGGGIFNAGNLDIVRSLIANNFATRGGGISNVSDGRIEITDSTISGNTSIGAGGGIRNVNEGRIFINHSTITQNSANDTRGGLSGNERDRFGGGIYNSSTARVYIGYSILAENEDNRSLLSEEYSPDCYSKTEFQFTSRGRNILGVNNEHCNVNSTFGDQFGTAVSPIDPLIGSLLNRVHMPRPDSPALDAGSTTTSDEVFFEFACREYDQNKIPRPVDGDGDGTAKCDIGAAEYFIETYEANIDGEEAFSFNTYSYGQTEIGTPLSKSFSIKNTGNIPLIISNPTVGDGFSLANEFTETTIEPDESYQFSVRLDATEAGNYSSEFNVTIGNFSFIVTLTGEVSPQATSTPIPTMTPTATATPTSTPVPTSSPTSTATPITPSPAPPAGILDKLIFLPVAIR